MAADVKLCIAGAGGRMGRTLLEAARAQAGVKVAAALDLAGSPMLGRDAGEGVGQSLGVAIGADIDAALRASTTLIDFTRPEGTLAHLAACRKHKVKAVIGTTGFTDAQKAEIADAARDIAIVFAPNMSVGVNVTLKLIELASRSLDLSYDIEVIEAHHKLKVDAPSGTALKMGEVAAAARGTTLKESGVFAREGVTGERKAGTIGFATVRGGDIVGDHTVMYAGPGECIEISHRSYSRANYAKGAMLAAVWLADKPAGLYDMQDVLGFK
jgi:4-hydroxy-tetrahydrodipicolinate reductase